MSGDVILLPKKLRAEWVDVMALDRNISALDFRVACVIGSFFSGKRGGDAYLGQATIARAAGISERAAWKSIKALEGAGYLIIKRRSLGEGVRVTDRGPVKVAFAGGRGVANVYFPAFERSQLSATNNGAKLALRCDQFWNERSQNRASKVASQCDPTLVSPSGITLQGGNPELGKAGDRLRQRLGAEVFASWFQRLDMRPEEAGGKVVVLVAPSRFVADYIRGHFADAVLDAWQADRPTVERVEVRWQPARAVGG